MAESAVSDKEILDVIRSADAKRLATAEIADELPIGRRQALNRLDEMEGDRVKREEVSGASMWRLDETEVKEPVAPEVGPWARRAKQINRVTVSVAQGGALGFVGGAILVFVSLTAAVEGFSTPFVAREQLLVWGYGFLGGGGAAVMLAGLGRLTTLGMMTYARWRFA